ncbi:hypothetical protein DSCW_16170 [Desulfosarcina widdelii]|uniref:Uncharacterized protein n=1 Tax=Desulfosarcina widdelii TaxID=947919 RepID=A0A5K7Z0L5_9BACT|nr:hypothetical protein DSCW_16170 [Desulfosarcina widdelii]
MGRQGINLKKTNKIIRATKISGELAISGWALSKKNEKAAAGIDPVAAFDFSVGKKLRRTASDCGRPAPCAGF